MKRIPGKFQTGMVRKKFVGIRLGLTLVEALIIIMILAVLIALLLPGTRGSRPAARRMACMNNLKIIAVAIHSYSDTYQSLPPAYTVDENGRRLHSWRTLILPFLDEVSLYETIDLSKPWDDPVNATAFKKRPLVYHCPSQDLPGGYTTYLGLVGEENFFHPNRPRQFAEITDSTSNTAMIFEVAAEDATHWMSPHDISGEYLLHLKEKKSQPHNNGGHIAFADETLRFISYKTSAEIFRALSTIAGDDDIDAGSW